MALVVSMASKAFATSTDYLASLVISHISQEQFLLLLYSVS
jgi:hypothetical protein